MTTRRHMTPPAAAHATTKCVSARHPKFRRIWVASHRNCSVNHTCDRTHKQQQPQQQQPQQQQRQKQKQQQQQQQKNNKNRTTTTTTNKNNSNHNNIQREAKNILSKARKNSAVKMRKKPARPEIRTSCAEKNHY
ncbi:unnamed protein product [Polarella glacialis]|uniref:Uncharacterized protein n=1 Tax=Polarella glacialis TaxID=89957 RepID=A0A813CZU6_POLGL|nr:unnamed protein product [Polarella glacialis]